MKDPIRDYLIEVREELYRLADGHDIFFEEYNEECQFDKQSVDQRIWNDSRSCRELDGGTRIREPLPDRPGK